MLEHLGLVGVSWRQDGSEALAEFALQQERAAELERQGEEIARLKAEASSSEAAKMKLDAALEQYGWAQKIFEERQDNLTFACEIPVRIDARIFALGKTISELIKSGEGDLPAP